MKIVSPISLSSVIVTAYSDLTKKEMGTATGFFVKYKENLFLITNYHVLSGRNFETDKITHSSGAVPGFIKISHHIKVFTGEKKFNTNLYSTGLIPLNIEVPIPNQEEQVNIVLWHGIKGKDGNRFDVAAMSMSLLKIGEKLPDGFELGYYDLETEIDKNTTLEVMDDVFIIGYPLKSSTTPNRFPIYKGATIASEPNMYKELPIFYVDGKTKKGMSGSPVIKRARFSMQHKLDKIEFQDGATSLIGIYSGRESSRQSEYEAELGIVWRLQETLVPLLDSMVSGKPISFE